MSITSLRQLSARVSLTGMSFLFPAIAAAQGAVNVGGQSVPTLSISGQGLEVLIGRIIQTVLFIAGIVVLAYLIYGGFLYITAGGDADKASSGRTAITNAIIGVIIIVASLAILNFVTGRVR